MIDPESLEFEFTGVVWEWRGPAPFHFVSMPEDDSAYLKDILPLITYGWGMIPVSAVIGATEFTTAMYYRDERFVVPLKDKVRDAEGFGLDDEVTVSLRVTPQQ